MTVRVRLSIGLLVMTLAAVATSIAPAGSASACTCSDEPLTAFADQAVAAFLVLASGVVIVQRRRTDEQAN